MGYLSLASEANKLNGCLEAEASRIQIEYERHARLLGSFFHSIDAYRIERQRFEDQRLLGNGK